MADQNAKTITLDRVEYVPENGAGFENVAKGPYTYEGITTRKSDGFTVLSLRAPGVARVFNIPVGNVFAVTIGRSRHVMETPYRGWSLRAAELRRVVEGFTEVWATDYFDPSSDKYFKTQIGESPVHLTDNFRRIEADEKAKRRSSNKRGKPSGPTQSGCMSMVAFFALLSLSVAYAVSAISGA